MQEAKKADIRMEMWTHSTLQKTIDASFTSLTAEQRAQV
jgi:hypothetical protein